MQQVDVMKTKLMVVFLFVSLLSGCGLFSEPEKEYIYIEKPMIHPERPEPVKKPNLKFKTIVIEEDGQEIPYVAMHRNDSGNFAIWMEELKAYIKKLNSILCFYRSDIDEPMCPKQEEK